MDVLIKHAKIVLIISLTLWLFYFVQWTRSFLLFIESSGSTNVICLFLILALGVSHGALDNLKGENLLKILKIKSIFIFYVNYIAVGFLVIFLWILLPTFTLIFFLIIASYHFGREDSYFVFNKKKKWHNFLFLIKGSLIIAAPLFFHNEETIAIFELLGANFYFLIMSNVTFQFQDILFTVSLLGSVIFFYFCVIENKAKKEWIYFALDAVPVILLNSTFGPLIAFTLYFCFIHSFRHSVSLINLLDKNNFKKGAKKFIKKALPLTLITSILFIISVYFLENYYLLDDAIIKVIFIGLASLTFPHILLEYLLEKNEK